MPIGLYLCHGIRLAIAQGTVLHETGDRNSGLNSSDSPPPPKKYLEAHFHLLSAYSKQQY